MIVSFDRALEAHPAHRIQQFARGQTTLACRRRQQ
jgi:hypothetical protein